MIKIKNLSKTYNYRKPNSVEALKNIDLEIKAGEMLAVTGKSGAGKSTLMHIIACVDNFESGEYYLNGKQISECTESQKARIRNQLIGTVFQDFSLIEGFSVFENVEIPLFFSKCNKKERRRKSMEALKTVGIADLAQRSVLKLSGGQKQRVAIARALVNDPLIILADEPTGALDVKTGNEILELFTRINAEGKTILIITHDADIASICKRNIVLEDGVIINTKSSSIKA